MKQKQLLRTLLAAVCLLVGTNAWAEIYQGTVADYEVLFGSPIYTDNVITGVTPATEFTTDASEQNYATMNLQISGSCLSGNQANGRTYSFTNVPTKGKVYFKANGKFVGGQYNFFSIKGSVTDSENNINANYDIVQSPYDLPRDHGETTVLRIFGQDIKASYVYQPRDVVYGFDVTIDIEKQKVDYTVTYASKGSGGTVTATSSVSGTVDVPEGYTLNSVSSWSLPRLGSQGVNYYDNVAFYSEVPTVAIYSYTVNAVDASDNNVTLAQLASGNVYANSNAYSHNIPWYVLSGNTLYKQNSNSASGNITSDGQIEKVEYTAQSITDCVFYTEGESIADARVVNYSVASNKQLGCNFNDKVITTLNPGRYKIEAMFHCGNGSQDKVGETLTTATFKAGDVIVGTHDVKIRTNNQQFASDVFYLEEATEITITLASNNSTGVDYVYIRSIDFSEETAAFNALKAYADALVTVDNDNSTANSVLTAAISTQTNVVAEATTAGAITNATTALKNAMYNYVAAANPTTGNQFDLTFLFTNPNFDNITNNGDAAAQGWFTDIPRSDLGTYNNFQVRTSLLDGKNAVERFTSNVCTTPNTYALYQKINLPAGRYSFSTEAMANQTSSIVMAVGDTEGDAITNAGSFAPYNMNFENATEAEMKIGIKISSEGTNACYWMALTNLKLYKEAASYVSVTIASSGYSSLGSAYGLDFANATTSTNGAAALTAFAATESSKTSVKLVSIDEAPAATGVILKGTPDVTYTIPVKANAAALTVTNLLHAAVTATDIVANTSYIMQGGKFHLVTADSTVPAGKAYLQATSGAKALTVVFADDLTGIANVNAAESVQPVKRIMNGQLVIEKNGKRFNAAGAEF